jgi:hypothetical protein
MTIYSRLVFGGEKRVVESKETHFIFNGFLRFENYASSAAPP